VTRTIATDLSFETPRVKARLLCEDDLDLYLALYTDPEVMRYIGPVLGREEVEAVFSRVLNENRRLDTKGRYWALKHRRTGQWLGQAALIRDAVVTARAEVGVMLLPLAQNAGIGLQTLHALVGLVASGDVISGVDELVARHSRMNDGAERLVKHIGFQRHDLFSDAIGWLLCISDYKPGRRWRYEGESSWVHGHLAMGLKVE
jgi:ribosomal-protein-alanine N-acetyltransferase